MKNKKIILLGMAGSTNTYSLSLYNLKSYAYADPYIRKTWDIDVIQKPLIQHEEYTEEIEGILQHIGSENPDIIGIGCYMWNTKFFYELSIKIKEQFPHISILFGGPEMATDYVTEGKYDHFSIDYIISGEGEHTFLEFLREWTKEKSTYNTITGLSFRKDGKSGFVVNEKREIFKNLLSIPSPYCTGVVDDELLFRPKIEAYIESQRGCNLRCSYCVYHRDMKKIIYSDVSRVVADTRFLINKGVKAIRYIDANFGSNLEHAKSIMRAIIHNKFETRLFFELIPGFIDDELAELFYKFNQLYDWNEITLGMGVQSINMDVLKKIRRSIKKEKFEITFDLLRKYKIYSKIDIIIGLPGETLASIENTLEYMIGKLEGSFSHMLCCHVMRGLPGTELLDIAKKHNMKFTSEYETHEFYESDALPRKDMLLCLRRTAVIFRLVNHTGWTNKEFLTDSYSIKKHIHNAFFKTKNKLGISNIALIDRVICALMNYLPKDSFFIQERFPYAEPWWWTKSKNEVSDEWLLSFFENEQK